MLCALVLAIAATGSVRAAPEAQPDDPLGRLIQETGILKPFEASGAVLQSLRDTVRDRASEMVVSAMNFLGVPYRRGGNSAESGFDCSGFTRYVFEHSVGLVLPRKASEQATAAGLAQVQREELKPGDLVFFNTMRATFSHVGIYVGDDKFIHAPRAGAKVRIEDMTSAYWTARFTGARRALVEATPVADAAGLKRQ